MSNEGQIIKWLKWFLSFEFLEIYLEFGFWYWELVDLEFIGGFLIGDSEGFAGDELGELGVSGFEVQGDFDQRKVLRAGGHQRDWEVADKDVFGMKSFRWTDGKGSQFVIGPLINYLSVIGASNDDLVWIRNGDIFGPADVLLKLEDETGAGSLEIIKGC